MTWQVESYQFVAFFSPQEVHDAFQIWLDLFQKSPDNYQRHPDPILNATMASGVHAGYSWQVQCGIGRIDLLLVGQSDNAASAVNPSSIFPVIGKAAAGLQILRQQLVNLLLDRLTVVRIGFVGQLFQNHPNYQSANKALVDLTKAPIDPEKTMDAMFSLNVRKSLDDTGITVNRVCRWQTLEKQMVHVQMNPNAIDGIPNIVQSSLSLNIDINTIPQQTAIRSNDKLKIADQLFSEFEGLEKGGYDRLIG